MKWLVSTISIGLCVYVSCRPQGASAKGGAAATPGTSEGLPLSWLMTAMPKTGIVGFADNFGAAVANFGNAQGAGFDAILSGVFSGIGTLFSGLLGSGAINTAFLNYNNRPPMDAGPTQAPAGGAAKPDAAASGGGGDGGDGSK